MIPINDSILFGGLSVLILIILFLYILARDKKTEKKLKLYERSIENLNKNLFKLEKKIEMTMTREQVTSFLDIELDEIKEPIYKSIKEIKQAVDSTRNNVESRVGGLEEKTKEYMAIPMTATLDEGRVVSLFKSGYSTEEITKELRANISEVSFVLKMKGLV